mgnify:FL=1
MAEIICRSLIEQDFGPENAEKYDVCSAGLFACEGGLTSAKAIMAVSEIGYEGVPVPTRPVTADLLEAAEFVFAMEAVHLLAVTRLHPDLKDKVMLLKEESDISDPIGLELKGYVTCAKEIENAIRIRLNQLLTLP